MWPIDCLGVWNRYLTERVNWARGFTNAVPWVDYKAIPVTVQWLCGLFIKTMPGYILPSVYFLNCSLPPQRMWLHICLFVFSSVWGTQKILRKWKLRNPYTMCFFTDGRGRSLNHWCSEFGLELETHKQSKQKEIHAGPWTHPQGYPSWEWAANDTAEAPCTEQRTNPTFHAHRERVFSCFKGKQTFNWSVVLVLAPVFVKSNSFFICLRFSFIVFNYVSVCA